MSWMSFPEGTREVVAPGASFLGHRDVTFRSTTDGSGPTPRTIVLVHGWMMTSAVWAPLLQRVSRWGADVRCIAVDLRGVGLSSAMDRTITLDRLADDVAALLDSLDLHHVSLVGHSMGGQVAALAASRTPDRVSRLTLVCPVPPEGLPLPEAVATSFRGAGGNDAALGGILDAACKRLDAEGRAALVEVARSISPDVLAAGFDAWTKGGIVADVERITVPTTVVATDDPFLPATLLQETWLRRVVGSRLTEHDGPGHYPQVEDADAFSERVRELVL